MSTKTSSTDAKSELPRWNLDDLYVGPESPTIQSDIERIRKMADDFAGTYRGKVSALSATEFATAIVGYEDFVHIMHKLISYAQLLYAADAGNADIAKFYQSITEQITDISTQTIFFELEINNTDDATFDAWFNDQGVAHYGPWLHDVRLNRPHQLSDDLEQVLHQKSVTGRSAWSRLFDETMVDMRIKVKGEPKKMTLADTLDRLSDSDGKIRKRAAKALGKHLTGKVRLFSLVTNTLAKDKEIEDRLRSFETPMASRNLANQVEDDVVNALVSAVRDSYPKLSHRYYALKAKWFGVEKLNYWDRNAPLPMQTVQKFTWDQARTTVLDAYRAFEPSMSDIAGDFFEHNWIDAGPRAGKDSGAFSHSTVPSAHPYILMNFHGKSRDVMTLAHELGHGVHQVLSAPRGTLMADTPLTLAETASVFGEMLTFQSMLENEKDHQSRQIMIAGKIEDMMNTVVRQIAFHEFETAVHTERAEGELTADRLGDIWMQIQRESLGASFNFDDDYRHYWAYIPHFIHSPFYVYAYAFGDCLVNSLYSVFENGHPGFQAKYLDMLGAGGTLRHKELLAPFGLDASDPEFWGRGLNVISTLIDQLEE